MLAEGYILIDILQKVFTESKLEGLVEDVEDILLEIRTEKENQRMKE